MDLSVILTYRCDSQCQMCYIWKNPTRRDEEVQLDTLEKLPGGFDNLNLTGGETTLRHDLPEIVDAMWKRARIVEISTNGLHADRLIDIVRKHPNTKIRFSLEGIGEINDRIRGEPDGYEKKVEGLKQLKDAGGRDLGFAAVIQDENADQLASLYQMAKDMDVELSTSALHNAFQFHKNDNWFYDRLRVAKEVEKLISAMLESGSVKDWFRAYMNLGLIKKILGQERLIRCTAGTDFAFIDPWADVWACNVRTDLPLGNLRRQSWKDIMASDLARESIEKVHKCPQNCWMVTTARTAMRSHTIPQLPKFGPLKWVIENKIRTALGFHVRFDDQIDYARVAPGSQDRRESFLGVKSERQVQSESDPHYTQGEYYNK